VPVGETARLLVRSGLRDQEMVLETYRDGRRIERRVLHAGHDAELIEIPITETQRGGFGVSLTVLRDHQLMRQAVSIHVPWDDRDLELEFASFRDTLRPGASESFRVTVRGHDQAAVDAGTAELLAYMYDRSLDIFAPHTPPSPQSLYPDRSSVGHQQSNLGTAQHAWRWSGGFAELPATPPDRRPAQGARRLRHRRHGPARDVHGEGRGARVAADGGAGDGRCRDGAGAERADEARLGQGEAATTVAEERRPARALPCARISPRPRSSHRTCCSVRTARPPSSSRSRTR
jgi:hypothetical protein